MTAFDKDSKLYSQVDEELMLFITAFSALLTASAAARREVKGRAERHIARALGHATKIGGRLLQDVETLDRDFRFFLSRSFERSVSQKVLQDALRIKHEVNEI